MGQQLSLDIGAPPQIDAPESPAAAAAARNMMASPGMKLALAHYGGSCLESSTSSSTSAASSQFAQDSAMVAELAMRLRRRPGAESCQFILNVAQLLAQNAQNAPLLLPLLPMILHGMARHLECAGVQVTRAPPPPPRRLFQRAHMDPLDSHSLPLPLCRSAVLGCLPTSRSP